MLYFVEDTWNFAIFWEGSGNQLARSIGERHSLKSSVKMSFDASAPTVVETQLTQEIKIVSVINYPGAEIFGKRRNNSSNGSTRGHRNPKGMTGEELLH